ncbi:STAS domain-containing protein [Actinoplanes sp. NPDC026623]|uniref:STAS domain-containing protein n=1 Tax=Actinoplanes sp. NPDC026623 TaxID=3155610 RepID=UPI0033FDF7D3
MQATGTVTGADGTVLATISRHTERTGGPGDAPLVVVDVAGDIDADTAPLLELALTDAISRNCQVCCDLSRVEFLGAAGINTILAALHIADGTGCAVTVRGVHGISARVFRITGLDAVLASRGMNAPTAGTSAIRDTG